MDQDMESVVSQPEKDCETQEESISNAAQQGTAQHTQLLNPLINEVRSLKGIMEENYTWLDKKYDKLEEAITSQYEEAANDIHKLEEIITT